MKDTTKLDLSSFKKAIDSLDLALAELKKDKSNLFVRDANIQRFEYTYELAHKMLKRYLEMTEANRGEIEQMSFPALIRTGAEKALLQNSWDIWSIFRTARNLTNHTYNEAKAAEVCEVIPSFLQEVGFLLNQLEQRTTS